MKYWTWGGKYIGIKKDDYLFSYQGKVVGKFYGEEIYNDKGNYLGEVKKGNRIIVNLDHKQNKRAGFSNPGDICGNISMGICMRYDLSPGFEDFIYQ